MLLEGKKALITGSRRSIGAGIALALAQQGCDIGLNDIERDDDAERTISQIEELERKVTFTQADLAQTSEINRTMDEFLETHGRIDILVNNHFWADGKPFLEITEEIWDKTIDTCLKSYVFCSQAAAKAMVEQGDGGSIVSISSVHAARVWINDTAYGVAKAGIIRLTQSMAVDLGGTGIRCNAIAPGYIATQYLPPERDHERWACNDRMKKAIPSHRYGGPADIAGGVVLLCSEFSDYVNGHCLPVDGGFLATGTP
ncbi:MAG: SDR family oxidoreductase [Planctomycetota bacterium]|nr:SDR family oxidoreductase [Planctomycetota bacterium]MDP6502231.1 SDR family oxidoreductase [Planctomycetota bacterium]